MIGHEHVRVNSDAEPDSRSPQERQEHRVVDLVFEEDHAIVPAKNHVGADVGDEDSWLSRHIDERLAMIDLIAFASKHWGSDAIDAKTAIQRR
jgi:hypothetical protein